MRTRFKSFRFNLFYPNTIFIILLLYSVIGCENNGLDTSRFIADPRKPTFQNLNVTISLVPTSDSTITLETKCLPLFNGKGRVILNGTNNSSDGCYEIISPINAKHCSSNNFKSIFDTSFTSGKQFSINWLININSAKHYTFFAEAFMDTIFVEDSCDLFIDEYDCIIALKEYREELIDLPLRAISSSINHPN